MIENSQFWWPSQNVKSRAFAKVDILRQKATILGLKRHNLAKFMILEQNV